MGPPIIALVLSLTAVAAFPFYPYYNPDVIDVFQAHPLHAGRSFMGWNPYQYDDYSPYGVEFRSDHYASPQFTLEDIFESPVAIVTPSHVVPNTLSVFYVHGGLRSLPQSRSFGWLREYLRLPGLKGLIFSPHRLYSSRFFNMPISSIFVPDNFKVFDLFDPQINRANIPYLFVAPQNFFDAMHFENIAKVLDFKVNTDSIEAFPAFYGSVTGASGRSTTAASSASAATASRAVGASESNGESSAGSAAGSSASVASTSSLTGVSGSKVERSESGPLTPRIIVAGRLLTSNEVSEIDTDMPTGSVSGSGASAASTTDSEASAVSGTAPTSSAEVPYSPSPGSVHEAAPEGLDASRTAVETSGAASQATTGESQAAAAPVATVEASTSAEPLTTNGAQA